MIYVIEKDFDRQLELLVLLASIENYSFCGWLYPESKISAYSGHSVTSNPKNLIPVTTYGDAHKQNAPKQYLQQKTASLAFVLINQQLHSTSTAWQCIKPMKNLGLQQLSVMRVLA